MYAAPTPSRRTLLGLGGAVAAGALAGCSSGAPTPAASATASGSTAPSTGALTASPTSGSPAASASQPSGIPSIARTPGPDIAHGPRTRQEVALTFHGAGTADITRGVLDALAAANALATVFAVGQWVAQDPSQVKAVHAAGHEVGNHTYHHLSMLTLDAATAHQEIQQGRDILTATLGSPGLWFRPSGTDHSNDIIRAAAVDLGYGPCISYDVDPEDFRDPGADLVRTRTLAAVKPGSIVSLHLGHAGTVTALPGILKGLTQAGLAPVTLSTLLRD